MTSLEMASESHCSIPRVTRGSLTAQATASEEWQLACEKLTLSLCRHNVCVVSNAWATTADEGTFDQVKSLLCASLEGCSQAAQFENSLAANDGDAGLLVRPGRHSYTFKLGSGKCGCLTSSHTAALTQAYNDMDRLARQALAAICRSCHVRLRCDTFSAILDDYPMQPGSVSSSALQYLQYMNNFGLRQAVGDKWTLTVSQEGTVNKGLVTVIGVNDTRQGISPNVCKLQVKDALGVWNDIDLKPGEVAILLGQTATQATAGLLRPAVYRTVGELYQQSHQDAFNAGRQELTYHLNARCSAVLDFHHVLQEAGHSVAERYAQPVCMKDILQRFDTVLTPPSMFKSPRSVQLGTIDVAAAKKRKRSSLQPAASSPVTRSGRVRRGNDGLRADPDQAKGGSSKEHGEEQQDDNNFAELVQAWRVYITVDGSSTCPTDFLPIGITHYQTFNTVWLRAHPIAPCSTIFETYCESMGVELQQVRFLRQDGSRVHGSELLMDLKLGQDQKIVMLPVAALTAAPRMDDNAEQ